MEAGKKTSSVKPPLWAAQSSSLIVLLVSRCRTAQREVLEGKEAQEGGHLRI